MNARDVRVSLMDVLSDCDESAPVLYEQARTKSFQDAGIVASEEGFVLRVGEDEFQITIVQSQRARFRGESR